MTLDLLGELVFFYRKSSSMSQEELAEKCDLSKTTISRVEKGIPVRKRTLERVVKVLKRPVFLCLTDYDAAAREVHRAELIAKLLSALRHCQTDRFSELFGEFMTVQGAANDIALQYEGFFNAVEVYINENDPRITEGLLLAALNLTFDTAPLFDKMRKIHADLDIGRSESNRRYVAAIKESLAPGLLETEILIMNAIAVCKYADGDFNAAECVYRALIDYLVNEDCVLMNRNFFLPTLYYNLSLCFFRQGCYNTVGNLLIKIKHTDDIYEDDRLGILTEELEGMCSDKEAIFRTPVPLMAFYRPGDFWPTLFTAKFLEENFLKKLKNPYSAPI